MKKKKNIKMKKIELDCIKILEKNIENLLTELHEFGKKNNLSLLVTGLDGLSVKIKNNQTKGD